MLSYGTLIFTNGGIYEGEWFEGAMHGKGIYTFANGNIYVGEWLKGCMNGYGVCNFVDGDIYEGEWFEGLMQGNGTNCELHINFIIYTKVDGDKYEG